MSFEIGGLFGFLLLVLDVWAIVKIVDSAGSTAYKVAWVVVIIVFPLIGLLIWFLFGRKVLRASGSPR